MCHIPFTKIFRLKAIESHVQVTWGWICHIIPFCTCEGFYAVTVVSFIVPSAKCDRATGKYECSVRATGFSRNRMLRCLHFDWQGKPRDKQKHHASFCFQNLFLRYPFWWVTWYSFFVMFPWWYLIASPFRSILCWSYPDLLLVILGKTADELSPSVIFLLQHFSPPIKAMSHGTGRLRWPFFWSIPSHLSEVEGPHHDTLSDG